MTFKNFTTTESKLVLLATIMASGVAFFETTSIMIAVPAIQLQFDATVSQLQWVMNSYALVLAVLILIMGSLSDRFGRKKLLVIGLLIFSLGNLLCGIADNLIFLIVARVIQGLGGAMMIPQSLAIINASYDKSIRGQAIGIWGGISGAMAIIGPFISGFIVDLVGWEGTFLIAFPIGIAAVLLIQRTVPESKHSRHVPTDWAGAAIIGTGLFLISYAMIEASTLAIRNLQVAGPFLAGLVLLCAFIYRIRTAQFPLIDPHVFSRRNVALANIYTLLLYSVIGVGMFFGIIYFQQYLGYSASVSGIATLPLSLSITLLSFFTGNLADRYGARIPMVTGAALVSLGMVFQAAGADAHPNYWLDIFPGISLMGIGFGMFIPALTKAALDVEPEFSGSASGVNNGISRLSGLIGVALLGSIVVTVFHARLSAGLGELRLHDSIVAGILAQSGKLLKINPGELPQSLIEQVQREIGDAFLYVYKFQLYVNATVAAIGAVVAAFMKEK